MKDFVYTFIFICFGFLAGLAFADIKQVNYDSANVNIVSVSFTKLQTGYAAYICGSVSAAGGPDISNCQYTTVNNAGNIATIDSIFTKASKIWAQQQSFDAGATPL